MLSVTRSSPGRNSDRRHVDTPPDRGYVASLHRLHKSCSQSHVLPSPSSLAANADGGSSSLDGRWSTARPQRETPARNWTKQLYHILL